MGSPYRKRRAEAAEVIIHLSIYSTQHTPDKEIARKIEHLPTSKQKAKHSSWPGYSYGYSLSSAQDVSFLPRDDGFGNNSDQEKRW